jgi:hypothetical protein
VDGSRDRSKSSLVNSITSSPTRRRPMNRRRVAGICPRYYEKDCKNKKRGVQKICEGVRPGDVACHSRATLIRPERFAFFNFS